MISEYIYTSGLAVGSSFTFRHWFLLLAIKVSVRNWDFFGRKICGKGL